MQGWENFYFLIGSAGAGLIGLLFVVVTLTSGLERSQTSRGAKFFLTPTAIHFAVVLTLSGVAVAPDLPTPVTAAIFGLVSLGGLGFAIRASIGIRTPPPGSDAPHWSDFWMYGAVPAAIYAAICVVSVVLGSGAAWAAPVMAGLLMVLLLVSIRNAWDLVTWIAPMRKSGV